MADMAGFAPNRRRRKPPLRGVRTLKQRRRSASKCKPHAADRIYAPAAIMDIRRSPLLRAREIFSNAVPARNAVTPARNGTVGTERAAPRPRLSTPRPAPEHAAAPAREARPREPSREAPPRGATP